MKNLLIALLLAALAGCAALEPKSEGAEAFTACKTFDAMTTVVAVNSGGFHEANPVLKGIVGPGWRSLIKFSVAVAVILALYNYLDEQGSISPEAHAVAAGVTCTVAARNFWLLTR